MQSTATAALAAPCFRRPVGQKARAQVASVNLRALQQQRRVAAQALGDSSNKTSRGTLKREDEPEEYWTSKAEREGKSPFQDPLAQIGILAIFFPFIFLAVAIACGWVDLDAGRL